MFFLNFGKKKEILKENSKVKRIIFEKDFLTDASIMVK